MIYVNPYYNSFDKLKQTVNKINNLSWKISSTYIMQGNRKRQNTSFYCWIHGACVHQSSKCKLPALGHQPDVTFEDKKGSSVDFCTNK